jgi:hypothetical protein
MYVSYIIISYRFVSSFSNCPVHWTGNGLAY